jgi:hypothetical protein
MNTKDYLHSKEVFSFWVLGSLLHWTVEENQEKFADKVNIVGISFCIERNHLFT